MKKVQIQELYENLRMADKARTKDEHSIAMILKKIADHTKIDQFAEFIKNRKVPTKILNDSEINLIKANTEWLNNLSSSRIVVDDSNLRYCDCTG